MSESSMTHIVVGCGGTGAKSAYRLAELMSRHPYWEKNMKNSVFFMLIDTDAGDLDKHVESISRVASKDTHVTYIQTTQGFNAPDELIGEFKDALRRTQEEGSAVRRFAQHWWAGNPLAETVDEAEFFEPKLKSIQTGAGQVPMVSFLAAWYAMQKTPKSSFSIEDAISELLVKIGNTRATIKANRGSTPLDLFNIIFVGSVAGGTGRGCAIPIAFKLKEMIQAEYKSRAYVNGFFLNEDCFEDLEDIDEYQRLNMKINAMTGWSELSSWIELNRGNSGKGYRYSLPGLHRAESAAHDALGGRDERDPLPDQGLATPFDWLGVICRTSGAGFSASDEDLYGMVATSLYMEITDSDIRSKRVNRNAAYFSVGSAIIDIDAQSIEDFFRDKAKWDAAARLRSPLETLDVEVEVDRVLDLLGLGKSSLNDLLKSIDSPKGVLQRLSSELRSDKGDLGDRVNKLVTFMQDQDAEGAKEELRRLLSDDILDELAKSLAISHTRLLASHLGEELKRTVSGVDGIAKAVVDLLVGDDPTSLFSRTLSARAVSQVAERVQKELKSTVEANGSLSDEMVQDWKKRAEQVDSTVILETASKRGGFLGMGKRFSSEEMDEVTKAVTDDLMCQAARALCRAMGMGSGNKKEGFGLISAISSSLTDLTNSTNKVCDAIQSVVSNLDLSANEIERQEELLFVLPENLKSSIPMDDVGFLTRRKIKPLMPDDSELQLRSSTLQQTVRDLLSTVDVGALKDRDDIDARVVRPISEALLSVDYCLKTNSSSHDQPVPILQAFELWRVLRKLAKAWPDYLTRLRREDLESFKSVEQDIERFYGLNLDIKNDSVSFVDREFRDAAGADYLMLAMAVVAARSCRPFWRTSGTQASARSVMVQAPATLDESAKDGWKALLEGGANLNGGTVKILTNTDGDVRFNPYAMIVFAFSDQEKLDEVASLDAWRVNQEVRTALEKAEATSKLMPFLNEDDGMWKGYRGSGFTDPIYVTHPELAKSRWRPWFRQASAEEDQTVMLALLYGWAGPEWFIRQKFPDSARGSKTVGPVFKFGRRASICIARRPGIFKGDKYSKAKPFDFQMGPARSIGKMAGEGNQVGESLNAVLQLLGPNGSSSAELREFRDGLVEEYQTFFHEIGDSAGFEPKRFRRSYLEILESLAQYIIERQDRKRDNDPEHPFVGELSEEEAAAGESSSSEFWKAAAEAVGITIERYRRLLRE